MDGSQAKLIEGEVAQETSLAPRPADALPAIQDSGAMFSLLERIIADPNLPMERVNQAFDFYQRVEAANAKKAFDAALAAAQAEFPPITKNRHVKFKAKSAGAAETDYHHEDLAEIVEKCGPILAKHGISHKWRTRNPINEPITVTCILTHHAGHSEENTLCGPRDESGNKNGLQGIASAVTYLERYTFKSSIGVASRHDDDGKGAGAPPAFVDEKQVEDLQRLVMDANADLRKFLDWAGVENLKDIPAAKFKECVDMLEAKRKRQK